jgi:class 3 adenylate cyclase
MGNIDAARDELERMLDELVERPDDRRELERTIERRFTQRKAVMMLDLSGFSRATLDRGIVASLLMSHEMRRLAEPAVAERGGVVVKSPADNLFCLFDRAEDALAASRAITNSLEAANVVLPDGLELYVSVGIGFGPLLVVGGEDMWGSEVNLAAKLGEDVADRGEILLTAAARAELQGEHSFAAWSREVSGIQLTYYAVST